VQIPTPNTARIELVLKAAIAQGLRTAALINPAGGKLIAATHPSKRKGERPHYRAVKIDGVIQCRMSCSWASAIYIIADLISPFSGVFVVSPAPLVDVLKVVEEAAAGSHR
jgi:hypothetical protein